MSVCINHLRREHIYKIMEWRNAQMKWLRQDKPLTVEDQERWFNTYLDGLTTYCPPNYLYAIYWFSDFIGYGGLVHIDWDKMEAEVSFLLNPEIENVEEIYRGFMVRLIGQAVKKFELKRITSETFANRTSHIEMLEGSGWTRTMVKHEILIV